jgi:hypothetical protein
LETVRHRLESTDKATSDYFLFVSFGGLFLKSSGESDASEKLKEQLLSKLRSHREVSSVVDLGKDKIIKVYVRTFHGGTFAPLVGTLELPAKQQEFAYAFQQSGEPLELAEKFVFVVDGQLLLIGAECKTIEEFAGISLAGPSVRDKIKELIGEAARYETVGPLPAHIPFLVSSSDAPNWVSQTRSVFLKLKNSMSTQQAIAEVYDRVHFRLSDFYNMRCESDQVLDLSGQIGDAQTKLLDMLVNLLGSRWFELPKRIQTIAQIRKEIADLLRLLSLHSSRSHNLQNDITRLEQQIIRDSALHEASPERIADEALAKLYWKDHTKVSEIDSNSILTVVEHVRSEIQVTQNLTVTFWAALVGAVVGSILTILGGNLQALAKLIPQSGTNGHNMLGFWFSVFRKLLSES